MNEHNIAGRQRFLLVQGVTLARVPLALIFAVLLYFLVPASPVLLVAGTCLLAFMEISDMLDGMLARHLGVVTEWGALLDPLADSISRFTVYSALASAHLTFAAVPWAMAVRDVAVAYCRIVWARHGVSGSARLSGKVKAVVQGGGAFFLLLGPSVFPQPVSEWLMPAVSWTVLVVTLVSLVEYAAGLKGISRK
jgi:CDP-diacylglycerol--glycerol-3-phosphate 3-phosphatidyltransferase